MSTRKSTRRRHGMIRYQDEDYDVPAQHRRVPREVTTDFAPPSPPRVPSKRRRITADPDFTPDDHNDDDDDDDHEPTPVDVEEVQELQQEVQEMQKREEDRDGDYSDTTLSMGDEKEFAGLPASPARQSPDPYKIYPLGDMEMIEDARLHYAAFQKDDTSYAVHQSVAVWYLDEQTKERHLGFAIIERVYQRVAHNTVWLKIRWYMQVPDLGIVTITGDTVNTHQLWYSEDYSDVSAVDVERHIHVRLVSTRDDFRELDQQFIDKPGHFYVCRSYDTQSGTFEQLASDHEEEEEKEEHIASDHEGEEEKEEQVASDHEEEEKKEEQVASDHEEEEEKKKQITSDDEEEERLRIKAIRERAAKCKNPDELVRLYLKTLLPAKSGDPLERIRNPYAQHQPSMNKSGDSRPTTTDLRTGPLDARLRRWFEEAMPELYDSSEFMQSMQRTHVEPCMDIGGESAADVGRREYLNRVVRSNTFCVKRLHQFIHDDCYACERPKPCTHMIQFANDSHQIYNIGSHCAERLDAVRVFYEFIQHLRDAQTTHPNLILEHRLQAMMKAMDRAYANTMK